MQLGLRQITNTLDTHEKSHQEVGKKVNPLVVKKHKCEVVKQEVREKITIGHIVSVGGESVDFGCCMPNTIHQRTVTLTLQHQLPQPLNFCMQIQCSDERLNQLPEFVFAIKKDKEFQFTDCYRFRLGKKGKYDFVIGVKTPCVEDGYRVESWLRVGWELGEEKIGVRLSQEVVLPVVECSRELVCPQGNNVSPLRVLKFSQIRAKLKKQVKIPFTLKTETKLTLVNQLLGAQHEFSELQKNLIEIHPRQLALTGQGVFLMTFRFNFTEEMSRYLQQLEEGLKEKEQIASYTLRRVLIMKVSQTNVYFHFPLEVGFFLGKRNGSIGGQ